VGHIHAEEYRLALQSGCHYDRAPGPIGDVWAATFNGHLVCLVLGCFVVAVYSAENKWVIVSLLGHRA
jgi:hypothetical protein